MEDPLNVSVDNSNCNAKTERENGPCTVFAQSGYSEQTGQFVRNFAPLDPKQVFGHGLSVDVIVETVIDRAIGDVAGYATDPRNEPLWTGGIVESTPLTDAPMAKGARVKRVAKFLGRRIEYVNEVLEYEPQRLLAMHSVSGPFPMKVRYEFEEAAGGTLARIRVQGEAGGFFKLASPLLAAAVKRLVRGDLKRLKRLLESDDGR